MAIGDAGDQGNLRPGQFGKFGNFTSLVHTHFLHRKFSILRQAGKADRDTNMIVKAALAGVATAKLRQGVPQHLFTASFANRTGDTKLYPAKSGTAGHTKLTKRL